MCFKPKRDPRIDEEQKRQREAASAAKEQARQEQEANRQKQLELEKEEKSTAAATEAGNLAKVERQSEMAKSIPVTGSEMTSTGLKGLSMSTAATSRRTARSGRGRRSLLTSSSGGMGYFSRFL